MSKKQSLKNIRDNKKGSVKGGKNNQNEEKGRNGQAASSERERAKSWAREWFDAILFAFIAALIIRTFFFEAFRIPTPSMENTLMTGDFLVVSKISYGPRTPMTVGIPFTSVYLPGLEFPWARMPGFTDVERYDIVVFNYPIDIASISRKTNYIKRCVGLPGDELKVDEKILYVNGEQAPQFKTVQKNYYVEVQENIRLSPSKVKNAGGEIINSNSPGTYRINMPKTTAEKMRQWSEVVTVQLAILPEQYNEFRNSRYTFSSDFNNPDHIPKLTVPYKGQEVKLNADNWNLYRNIIVRYENNDVQRNDGEFIINGEETNTYTIKKDYYFMMGDNRDNSQDSRFWGFVPHDHVVGKASMIYFSWNHERMLPRFGRMFNLIH